MSAADSLSAYEALRGIVALPDIPEAHDDPAHELAHEHENEHFDTLTLPARLAYLTAIVLPFVGLVAAIVFTWGWGFSWTWGVMLVVGYLLTAVGVTVGYHRLFTHRAFKTGPAVSAVLAFLGSLAVEGNVTKWAAVHRAHHKHSDDEADPHSPHLHGSTVLGMLYGFYHAHMGWLLRGDPKNLDRYNPDLRADPVINFMGKTWGVWAILGLVIPAAIGGLLTMSWGGVLLGFLWGGLVRIFLVHHITWSINSVCHVWGTRPFRSHDESRNNFLFGVIGLGEGWHNNHHAFPTSARHGLRWWEFDASYLIIRGLEKLGLAWDVKVPDAQRIAAKAR